MRRNKSKLTSIQTILNNRSGKAKYWQNHMKVYEPWIKWKQVVGENIGNNTNPKRWSNKVLVVSVRSSAWMQELSFMKEQLLERIRKNHPKIDIEDIRFEIGEIKSEPEKKEKVLQNKKLPQDIEEFIQDSLQEIDDPDLREVVEKTMRKDFCNRITKTTDQRLHKK